MNPDAIRLSHSGRKLFHECPRKFHLHQHYRHPFTPRQSTETGKGFHKIAELLVTDPENLVSGFERWSRDVLAGYSRETDETRQKIAEAHEKAWPLFKAYTQLASAFEPKITSVFSAEHPFLTEIGGCNVPGVIDQIVLVEDGIHTPFLAVLDFKTTSLDLDLYVQALAKSQQGPEYLIYAKSKDFRDAFPGLVEQYGEPQAVIFDVLKVPAIRQKKSETRQEFLERLEADVITNTDQNARRVLITPSCSSLAEVVASFDADRREHETYSETNFWPKREQACLNHTDFCEYAEACEWMTEGRLIQLETDSARNQVHESV